MWDFFDKQLNKIGFTAMTVWLSLFVMIWIFTPDTVRAYLVSQPLPLLPDGSFFALSVFTAASVLYLIGKLLVIQGINIYKKLQSDRLRYRLIQQFNALADDEWLVVMQVFLREEIDSSLKTSLVVERLKAKEIIRFSLVYHRLEIHPLLLPTLRNKAEAMINQ